MTAWARALSVVAVVLALAAMGLSTRLWLDAKGTEDALCALRADLEKRVEQSQKFLVEHPEGVADIPAQTIRDGIENQQRTIDALSSLSCPPSH